MPDNATMIAHTQKWVADVIIGHTLCPFAKREFDSGRILYAVVDSADMQSCLEQVLMHCEALDDNSDIETSLLIFPNRFSDFRKYLKLLGMATDLLKAAQYEGVYQLASFHPKYRFRGSRRNDASNYTNRSPYPVLHILREASVTEAVKNHPNPEGIPARNIALMEELGVDVMRDLLARCYE